MRLADRTGLNNLVHQLYVVLNPLWPEPERCGPILAILLFKKLLIRWPSEAGLSPSVFPLMWRAQGHVSCIDYSEKLFEYALAQPRRKEIATARPCVSKNGAIRQKVFGIRPLSSLILPATKV
jgi:hypothetical protein